MTKLYLSAILIVACGRISAQNEYFANDPGWVCYYSQYPWPCETADSINYYINGDTTINATTYKVLYKRGHVIQYAMAPGPNPCNMNYTYQDTVPTGFMRSQGLQMYYIPNGDTTEYLLYDFNLTTGSHLPITYVNSDTSYTVTYIDSIYTAAVYRNRYFLNGNNFEYLIEGVGSSAGLLYPLGGLFEQTAELICYSQNDTAWFPGQGPGCAIITGTSVAAQKEISLQLFPNPAAGEFTCITGEANSTIDICNVLGEIIYSASFNARLQINLSAHAAGIYTCVIRTPDKSTSKNLILE